jgi:hypothetical protein
MNQARQPVCAIEQSIYLDVYGCNTQTRLSMVDLLIKIACFIKR